jgi:hypothetical protein
MKETIADDRIAYAGYVQARLEDFWQHAGHNAFVWDFAKLQHAPCRPRDTSDAGAFKGPWRNVKNYVTTEFREWVDEYYAERKTFAEWRAERVEERRVQAIRDAETLDSAGYKLGELALLRDLLDRRDDIIMGARERGATWADIARAAGLSRQQLHNIAVKHRATFTIAREELAGGVPDDWDTPF